jgi:hypothetical protein
MGEVFAEAEERKDKSERSVPFPLFGVSRFAPIDLFLGSQ